MWIYNLVVRAYGFSIWLASLNNPKAAQWVRGRKNWRQNLKKKINTLGSGKRVWVHCASYGEFEQGRVLIETIKNKHPHIKIVLSFFSPSGYEAFKDWESADVICYLPLDTPNNAKDFIKIVEPATAIFIKYEFWVNFLFELKKQNIPNYLVSAVFKPHHPFFKWYGGLFRKSLSTFTQLFVQDVASGKLLETVVINNYLVSGDTRFDRVLKIKEGNCYNQKVEAFKAQHKLIIAGSTWPGDEELLIAAFDEFKNKGVKLIIAPHEINQKSIEATIKKLESKNMSYTLYLDSINPNADVLILNTIGVLSKSYYYANCAYVGGGFNGGLHNILEPAVFRIPVSFYGSDFEKYNEAIDLVKLNAARVVLNTKDLSTALEQQLFDETYKKETSTQLTNYFEANANASAKVLDAINLN